MASSFPKDKTVYLIDGLSLIFRSYHAFKGTGLSNVAGENTNAFVGFFRSLFSIFKQHRPHYLAVILDSKQPTFRKEIYPDYKANRDKPPSELLPQIGWIKQTLQTMEVPILESDGYEADDLLASLAYKASQEGWHTYIISPDKDLLQMVNENTHILKLEKNGFSIVDRQTVKQTKGVWPHQIHDYLSLLGDSSDNIPGVKGIGEKTASRLLETYDNLDNIYANISEIKPKLLQTRLEKGQEDARLSYQLVELKKDLYLIDNWHQLECKSPSAKAEKYFIEHNALSLVKALKQLSTPELSLFRQDETLCEAQMLKPKHKTSKGDYRCLMSLTEVKSCLQEALKAPVLVLDTETSSLNTLNTRLLGIAISYQTHKGFYIPLQAKEGHFLDENELRLIFNDFFSQNPKIIGHNLKFDWEVLISHGFKVPDAYADTMLMAWLLDSSSSYKMDFLALKYLNGYTCIAFKDLVNKGENFSSVALALASEYSAEDADITLRLYEKLLPLLKEKKLDTLLFDLEMPLMRVLIEMETKGICVDSKKLKETARWIEEKTAKLEKSIFSQASQEFNILSSQQTQNVLVRLNLVDTKGKETFSTSSTNLKKIGGDSTFLQDIVLYRSYKKLINSYLNTLPKLIDKKTGRIHTSFFQPGTETGRLSSANPNLQNIPIRDNDGKLIRQAFIAPEGKILISADYSQIELVVLAHLSADPALCESFRTGQDIHAQTAKRLFKTEVPKEEHRRIAKTINFGVLYKMSAFRLANELKIEYKEAKAFIQDYFETYKKINNFFEEQIAFVEKYGYSQTLLGHRRPLKGIYSQSHLERAEAERAAINSVIQGSAADIVKVAMIKTTEALKKANNPASMLLQVHDELVFEVEKEQLLVTCQLIKEQMEQAVSLIVPLKVQVKAGPSWGSMQEL